MKKAYSRAMSKYITIAVAASVMLIVCAAVLLFMRVYLMAAVEGLLGIAAAVSVLLLRAKRRKEVVKYLHKIVEDDMGISENALMSVPLPMAVCSIDGTIRWYNDMFACIFSENKLPDEVLDDIIPELKWSEVLKYPSGKDIVSELGSHTYSVHWCMLKDKMKPNEIGDHYSVFFYLKEITKEKQLEKAYEDERTDIAIINIDNYDDYAQKTDDEVMDVTCSKIRYSIMSWAKNGNAVIKKTDNDRFFMAFEHQYLERYINLKFPVIEDVRKIAAEAKFPLSISVGIGTGGSIADNEISARHALDMALGRGGDQVCIKNDTQFRFYGGKNREYERSTRVKARAVASALKDFIQNSDNVFFMGHRGADYDCFGAAVGLQRAVRGLRKIPYIVHERNAPAVEKMYSLLKNEEEYNGMFVNEDEVLDEITADSLLIILDTHRPSMLPCKKLLDRINKVVLIDHHRRSTEFISPCSLVYHEPYASSTCEMATELLEYMNLGDELTKMEAQCLYTGILMDTKNFILKTGVRTFEAASYLRKLGLDTIEVRKMFSTSRDDYTKKAEIVGAARLVSDHIAVAKTYTSDNNMRVIASQAADEMLNLNEVRASIVVYPMEAGAGVSARSLGDINVQLIMEKLGGGGHMTVSGAQIKGASVDEAVERAEAAVRSYIADTK